MFDLLDLFTLTFYFLVALVIMVLLGKNMFHQHFPAITPYAAVYKSINAATLF